MTVRAWAFGLAGVAVLVAGFTGLAAPRQVERSPSVVPLPLCEDRRFEGADYVVCDIDPEQYGLVIAHNRPDGSSTATVRDWLAAQPSDARILLAMNAGMYRPDGASLGLLVEDGRVVAPLNLAEGEGNFFLRPNGVFAVSAQGRFEIVESQAFADSGGLPAYATQSAP